MPIQEMRSESLVGRADVRWFHTETVTDATSDPLIIPSVGRDVAVAVTPGTAASLQYTLSNYAAIEEGSATWHDWPAGEVVETNVDSIAGTVSALRLVSTGASTWEVTV
ncbi:hypothetical protein [Billgrantia bachuensis]|uniref:Uncharacterized protein n=1 Tax=Billgrantia bachuensis TaxID=2717286 RepID=A0ABX0PQP3_9GAMM|nr:hypothetical protein [Halomonas bachuensis]NIC05264.1 hypothetical protein [Halomonas bachuensis]